MNKKLTATLVLTSLVASAFTLQAGAANDKQVLKDETGAVHTVAGSLGKISGNTPETRAFAALEKVKADFGFDKADKNFKIKKSHKDENGTAHTKLDRVIDGIPVFGEQLIVHEADGALQGVSGTFEPLSKGASKASVKAKDAVQGAIAHTGYTGELSEAPTAELVYYPQDGKAVLSYQINVHYVSPEAAGNWQIFIDAVTGNVVDAINAIDFAQPGTGTTATGTGTGVNGDRKTINTSLVNGSYVLEDTTKYMYQTNGSKITTLDYRNGTSSQYAITDADNNFDAAAQRAGVDAHYYAGATYDYYYSQLGRNSINGSGMAIKSGVRYATRYNNAFWDGRQMTYGDGDGTNFKAFSGALDVVAHELTHGVTDYTSKLVYQNQSGALNESWSDAIGAVLDSGDWLLGEDITLPGYGAKAFRSMSDPGAYGDPDHMSKYVNTTSDNGGVHTNSGIPNKAFYNFATAIGSRSIAGKIWYTASRDYMTSRTNFSGARAATLQATAALYGSSSSYYTALKNAWTAVGVN
ncbi:thermolysin [Tumebacillus sp. BK434]|uniref:M4 family metallopeptidase n=1 Tax=Tumebacillus sp. BK434 TaxID=2512169 RepID=UPI001043AA32|nr:M4 family metallopeptidase [Tumebacillus sp. BK434]TCP57636.1 thermolysin [Tumebacillus sp. BK434]